MTIQYINIPSSGGGGGGGTPGGANTSIQYNNGGSFGGFGTWDGSTFDVGGILNASTVSASVVSTPTISDGFGSIDLINSYLKNSSNTSTVGWEQGNLLDPSANLSVGWSTRILYASVANEKSFDWNQGLLYANGGAQIVLDYKNQILSDIGGSATVNWNSHLLILAGAPIVDWGNQVLSDNLSTPYFSWHAGIGFFGVTPVVRQISSGAQTASGSYSSIEQTMLQQAYDALRAYGLMT